MRIGYNARLTCGLLLTALLTIAFCLLATGYLRQTVQGIAEHTAVMANAVQSEDWPTAANALEQGLARWRQARPYWLGLMNHQEVTNIDTAFLSLQAFEQEQKREEVLNQLALLNYYLGLAVTSDSINWSNIF